MTGLIVWLAASIVICIVTWLGQRFIYPVLNFFTGLARKFLVWFFGIVVSVLYFFGEELFRIGKHVYHWIVHATWEMWSTELELLIAELPEESQPNLETVMTYINAANHWVPLDLAVSLITIYLGFGVTWAAYFMVKRHIPTLGK